MTAVALLAMNSCTQEEEIITGGEQKGTPVNFVMGVNTITRTVTEDNSFATTFTNGDQVGIFAYTSEGTAVQGAQNILYTFNGTNWESTTPISMTSDDTYIFYAYYPYNANATSAESVNLAVSTTQNTDGYAKSDALTATSESVTGATEGTTTTVPLKFAHAFSMVQVTLDGDQASDAATVTLYNVATSATINLIRGTAIAASETGIVSMKNCDPEPVDGKYSYRAIVPVQTIAQGAELLRTTSNETVYSFKYNSDDVSYNKGKLRQINITLGQTANESTITISNAQDMIENWVGDADLEPDGGEGEIIDEPEIPAEPVTSIEVPITSDIVPYEGGKYASNNKLEGKIQENGWFKRFNDAYGASLTFNDGNVQIIMPETCEDPAITGVTKIGWNMCAFGYHINGPIQNSRYQFTCEVTGNSGNGTAGGIMVRTSEDDNNFGIEIDDSENKKTINTFNLNDGSVSISFIVDFSQTNSKSNGSPITDTEWQNSTENNLKDIYIYIYNYQFNTSLTFSNIKLELVTE